MIIRIFDILREKLVPKNKVVRTVIYILLVIILSGFIYLAYNEYKKTIIVQQEQQMLSISRSISRSIEMYTDDAMDSVEAIALDKDFIKSISYIENGEMLDVYDNKIRSYYEAKDDAIDSICFYNKNGKLVTQYPKSLQNTDSVLQTDIDAAISKKKTYIGKVHLNKSKDIFIYSVYQPIFDGDNFKGVISVQLRVDAIYKKLIADVKVGEKGYAMVKDQDGIIIMHQLKEQIGIDVIETRKQMHPGLDFRELEELIDHQLKGDEGTAIYHSYWWWESSLKKAKKLNAYTPAKLGNYFWIVAVTMSYDEVQRPINRFLVIVIGIVIIIIIIIYFFLSELFRMKKNKEALEKETEYLRILNESSEKLRKKEAELYHSHKLKMIGTLAGGIAHDINNLLTPILGYSELLLMRTGEDEEYYEDIEEILKASKKGKDLIEQILLFTRNDKENVKIEPVNINDIIKETINLLKAVIPKNVTLKENINKDCGYIKANPTQIHQVIFNLCTNAYQSVGNSRGEVEICLNTVSGIEANNISNVLSEKHDYVELMIKDDGCGIDEETKKRIFDPFFTTKDIGKGSGLGLFVVQSIVNRYGGVIMVDSEIDMGSCFKVYLPLVNEESDMDKSENSERKLLEDKLSYKKRILVIDDSLENIKVIKKSLEHVGFQVVARTDGRKAIKLFKKNSKKFDIVITDYMMPNIKGIELAAEIKKIKNDAAVILMSGYVDESDVNYNSIVDAFVRKPIELSELLEAINKII
ncbi:histidine kinase [Clostridium carboxidivorans P7]|uniref:Stage 0 sporulation protein A homolog n=2 Tax=Clostridium TaxID=1485 RepID=C6Q0M6_9CLOT|nr:sensor histidine kinase [Clostridium carboxidivorans]AKN32443.1 histidine kinase [Clostridium carboxidivorans P7]EET84963.1 histidine kinase [Clostridium carboxidivorans P7]